MGSDIKGGSKYSMGTRQRGASNDATSPMFGNTGNLGYSGNMTVDGAYLSGSPTLQSEFTYEKILYPLTIDTQLTGQVESTVSSQDEKKGGIDMSKVKTLLEMANKTQVGKGGADPYEKIVSSAYDNLSHNSESANNQIVDILQSYPWNIQKFNARVSQSGGKISGINDVPFCYVTEWKQTVSSNIMNIINSISAGTTAVSQFVQSAAWDTTKNAASGVMNGASEVMSKLKNALFGKMQQEIDTSSQAQGGSGNDNQKYAQYVQRFAEGATQVGNILGEAAANVVNIGTGATGDATKQVGNPAMVGKWLAPYMYLYALKQTGKKYCFPMVASPSIMSVTNTFGDPDSGSDGGGLLNNSMFDKITSISQGLAKGIRDIKDIVNFLGKGGNTFMSTAVEKAKYFNFPTNTQEYKVTFPLLNTVSTNSGTPAWKKNYRFILLFILRNMLFRRDNSSYYPPLFYDLVIPGVIRQPFCYVSKIQVRPLGMVRTLSYDEDIIGENVRGKGGGTSSRPVQVPQAWIVTISFMSLLTTSSNMILSGLYDININTTGVANDWAQRETIGPHQIPSNLA